MRPIKNPDIDMPADPFAETQPDLASNATRIRDIVCIVENFDPHPDEDSEQGDDYGHCHECKAVIELEPGDEWTPFCNDCAHAIVEELARAVQEQRIAIRRAESERDAQHAQVLRLTGEREELFKKIEEFKAFENWIANREFPTVHETPVDGVLPCCGRHKTEFKDRLTVSDGPLVNCDRMRLLTRVGELTSTNLLLTKERDAARAQADELLTLREKEGWMP